MTAPLDLVAADMAEAGACVLRAPVAESWTVWRVRPAASWAESSERRYVGTATDAEGLAALCVCARLRRPAWIVVTEHHAGGAS